MYSLHICMFNTLVVVQPTLLAQFIQVIVDDLIEQDGNIPNVFEVVEHEYLHGKLVDGDDAVVVDRDAEHVSTPLLVRKTPWAPNVGMGPMPIFHY